MIFADPKPTCELATVRGEYVTLACSMSYYHQSPRTAGSSGAYITASLSWATAAAGQSQKVSSTTLKNSNNEFIGQTLTAEVTYKNAFHVSK